MNNDQLFQAILELAEAHDVDPAELSMTAIAGVTGVSRSSLYRRFGSRNAIDEAMRKSGYAVGLRFSAEQRVLVAAHDLIVNRGVQALTLESVATSAKVALPTVYGLFGNRSRLMRAVFTRYSPVPRIAEAIPDVLPTGHDAFVQVIEDIYLRIWDFLGEEQSLIFAIIAEISRDPTSIVMEWLRLEYLPQVVGTIFPILVNAQDAGLLEDGHPAVMGQSLIGPMIFHFVSRSLVEQQGFTLPDREDVCADLARRFCDGSWKGSL